MNKYTRKQIKSLHERLEAVRDELMELTEAEQDKFDNMPEGLQEGERGQALEEAADNLSMAADSVDNVMCELDDLVGA